MKWNRFNRFFCFLACGGVLLQTSGCDTGSILGNLAAYLLVNTLLGGLTT